MIAKATTVRTGNVMERSKISYQNWAVLSKMRDLATSDSDFTKKMVELGVIVL